MSLHGHGVVDQLEEVELATVLQEIEAKLPEDRTEPQRFIVTAALRSMRNFSQASEKPLRISSYRIQPQHQLQQYMVLQRKRKNPLNTSPPPSKKSKTDVQQQTLALVEDEENDDSDPDLQAAIMASRQAPSSSPQESGAQSSTPKRSTGLVTEESRIFSNEEPDE